MYGANILLRMRGRLAQKRKQRIIRAPIRTLFLIAVLYVVNYENWADRELGFGSGESV